jgi:predicted dehydrogenase
MRSFAKRAALLGCLLAATGVIAAQKETPVQLITVDPGHFHAALVQKFMLPGVSPEVRVFAPEGEDLTQHMKRIEGFNSRADQPTHWRTTIYSQPDWERKAWAQGGEGGARHVVVLSGNNAHKTEYITRAIGAGMNVLADKPMVITPDELPALEAAFAAAKKKGVLLYDIMTERFEIATILQRELSMQKALFGTLEPGTPDDPAISKISVHNFSKVVAGAQLKRPQWFFDPEQQGAGIVDVTTHLVDLVQWEAFPGVALQPSDAEILSARRWPTKLTLEQFTRVTGATEFPAYLSKHVRNGVLLAPANGEFTYRLRGIHAKVSVTWDFEAPPGAGDTHYSVMRGTKASLIIKQGRQQRFKPTLYVERAPGVPAAEHEQALMRAIEAVAKTWPGVGIHTAEEATQIFIPDAYHNGHEAHFTQVTEQYLKYLQAGKLPDWEVPNMLTKYATLMQAYEKSR